MDSVHKAKVVCYFWIVIDKSYVIQLLNMPMAQKLQ
jgi:hypothetical protein